jgi:CheY-like chemotaxis protein
LNIDASAARAAALGFPAGGGEMGALTRQTDWSEAGEQTEASPDPMLRRPARLHILVAEDEPFILMDTADILRDLGHAVFEAGNGRAALEIAEANQLDVLLTDIHLPDMSGVELSKMLQLRHPAIRIVFASGRRPDLSEAPGARFVIKPYSQQDLERVLEEASRQAGGG